MNDKTHADVPHNVGIVILLCVLASLCEGIDLQAAGMAGAGIRATFHAGPEQLGTFFSASTLGLFIGALVGGRLSDWLGRKNLLVISVAVFGVFSVLNGLAWNLHVLAWTRFLTGVGIGGALPTLLALVTESSPDNRRSFYVTLAYCGMPLGGAIISTISLWLTSAQWRWIFLVGGILPLVVAPLMAIYLKESPRFLQSRARTAGIHHGSQKAGNAVAVFTEGRALPTLLLWVSFFLGLLTLYLLLNWLPLLMQGVGLSARGASLAQIGFNIGGVLGAVLIGRLLEGPWRQLSIWSAFIALPALIYALAVAPTELKLIVVIVFFLGSAVLAVQAFLYAMAPACYPTHIRGVGVGLAVAVGRIGSYSGPKLGGIWKASGLGTDALLLKLLPLVILGSLFAIALSWVWSRRESPRLAELPEYER